MSSGSGWVLGVDSGGSGLRLALARATDAPAAAHAARAAEPVRTGPDGIDPDHMLTLLLPAAGELLQRAGAQRVDTVCVGAAGMATLGDALRARLPRALRESLGAERVALAADAVTAYAGALGERAGAVIAAGTGLIALGTELRRWRRADGWGHLLGDCGGGAWIGRAGLEAALRAHDGRDGGSPALLTRAEAVFGPAAGIPGRLYPRTDRAAVLASFAPEVARCADTAGDPGGPDPVAAGILHEAAREIARTAAAVCPDPSGGRPAAVALTGGLLKIGPPLLNPLERELAARLPHARTVESAGDPLDGSVLVAGRLARGVLRLPEQPPLLVLAG